MREDIKEILDEALEKSSLRPQSVLILGPAGTGKTTTVKGWLAEQDGIRPYYYYANTCPSAAYAYEEALLYGIEPDESDVRRNFGIYFGCNEIDSMNEDGRVLFIDHFDLTYDDAREHLLMLVKNRDAVYTLDGELKHLDKLRLIIAAGFEFGSSHFGYSPLKNEQIDAFDYVIFME